MPIVKLDPNTPLDAPATGGVVKLPADTKLDEPQATPVPKPPPTGIGSYLRESASALYDPLRQIPGLARDIGQTVASAGETAQRTEEAIGSHQPPQPTAIKPKIGPKDIAEALGNVATFTSGGLLTPLSVGAAGPAAAYGVGRVAAKSGVKDIADAVKRARDPTKRAQDTINAELEKAFKAKATTPTEIGDQFTAARLAGQPFTLSNLPSLQRLTGSVFRSGGTARPLIEKFYKDVTVGNELLNTAAGKRLDTEISKRISPGNMRMAAKDAVTLRSAHGEPLWSKAVAGGSLAPLRTQFENAWNEASKSEHAAMQDLANARQMETAARAAQATGGNVYSASAANRALDEAQQMVRDAEQTLRTAQEDKATTLEHLNASQADIASGKKGAVWSPQIQRILDRPEVKGSLRKAYDIAARHAIEENRSINATDFAITGFEADGTPIVSKVPNMRAIQLVKEGLSAMLDQPEMRDEYSKRLTKEGASINALLHALLREGDRLNPDWKIAREVWAGDTAVLRALDKGHDVFAGRKYDPEELAADWQEMSNSEREFFRIGAGKAYKDKIAETPLGSDESKAIMNAPATRQRLRVLFDNDKDFEDFVNFVDREHTIHKTPGEVMRGSQTEDRRIADVAHQGGHALYHLMHGNVAGASPWLADIARKFGLSRSEEANDALAKILTNPNVPLNLSPGQRLLDPVDLRPRGP